MRLFRKKFKVRVNCCDYRNNIKDRCVVEYAHYRFFPKWKTINTWLVYSKAIIKFEYSADKCEVFAAQFKSIEDIREHEKKLNKLNYQHNKTYHTKTIISK